jgi:type VI protein secretion system component Hcp
MRIFMRWGESHVPGLTQEKGYEKWVELESLHWSLSGRWMGGRAGTRDRWTPDIGAMVVRRRIDLISPEIIRLCLRSRPNHVVEVHFARSWRDGDPLDVMLSYTLSGTQVTDYQLSADGGWPMETFSLVCLKVQVRNWTLDRAQGRKIPAGVVEYALS